MSSLHSQQNPGQGHWETGIWVVSAAFVQGVLDFTSFKHTEMLLPPRAVFYLCHSALQGVLKLADKYCSLCKELCSWECAQCGQEKASTLLTL